MSAFSDILRDIRKEYGFTQEKLCELMGISRDTLYNWENDKRFPDINELKKLCEIFECDSGYLLGEYEYKRAVTIPISNTVPLSITALNNLIKAAGNNNSYIKILSALLEDESLLQHMSCCSTADYGNISTFVDIPDPFAPKGTQPILISPQNIQTGDKMQLYNDLCIFIDKERIKNGLP